jgi:hypothetical protein
VEAPEMPNPQNPDPDRHAAASFSPLR